MRIFVVLFLLLSVSCFAQTESDTIPQPPAITKFQEGNPWNGTLITAMQNPAFAGFDRRLQVGYTYEGQNLKVPEGYNTKKSGFWNQTAIVDFAFGGKRNNVGVNITYNGGQRLITDYHRLNVAHSYRLHLKQHKFILGLGLRYLKLERGSMSATYGDMITPVYGFLVATQETYGSDSIQFAEYSAGLIYNWKRIFFGYAFRYEHRSLLTAAGKDLQPFHHLNASYNLDFGAAGHFAIGFTAEYDNFNWNMEPSVLLMWKHMAFVKVSAPDLKQIKTEIGLQIWRIRVVYSVSTYYKKYQIEQNGIASMAGGIRYHFQPLIPKKK